MVGRGRSCSKHYKLKEGLGWLIKRIAESAGKKRSTKGYIAKNAANERKHKSGYKGDCSRLYKKEFYVIHISYGVASPQAIAIAVLE